jgi:hypothetical protein
MRVGGLIRPYLNLQKPRYIVHIGLIQTNHQKIFYNPTHVVYTGDDLNYGNSYNTNYRYTITESIINENGTTYITSNASFDSYITDGTNYTIYWYTRHDNYYLWKDFSSSFNSIIHDYKGYNKWYYIKNILITSNKEYTVRAWIDVPISTEKQSGKYYFAIKPSHETISQAITNGHFYNLDPWWNATWSNRKNITLTGNTSGAQTNYQLLLNVTYEDNMQNDYDDLRFCNETHKLDSWLESKVDGSYALIWVEFPTTPANGVDQTYYMYYGNAEAASNWDGGTTFSFFDDFPGASLDADKWELVNTPDITVSGGILTIDNNDVSEYIRSKTYTTTYGKAIRTRQRDYTASHYPGSFAFGERTSGTDVNHVSKVTYTTDQYMLACNDGAGAEAFSSGNAVDDSYHLWDLTWLSGAIKLIKNGAQDEILTTEIPSASLKIALGGQVIGGSFYGNSQGSFDWIFVRKYAANPPTYTFGSEEAASYMPPYMPPNPISLMNTTGNFWINHTWSPGSSNVTNSYNVSVNNVWHNTSPAYYNDTYAPHAWQNITVWAYNSTGTGTLSTGSISQNTQIPNNPITITNTSDWSGDAGEVVYVDYDATDIDSDTATFSCDRTDLFTDFDTSTGTGNWTATANIYYVDFGVSDGYGSISNYTMTLTESSVEITLLDELKLIMSEMTSGLKSINMGDYLVYAFILIGILLIILLIQILNNCIYRG